MTEVLISLLERFGYLIAFAAPALENVFGFGFFMPGEVPVFLAAVGSRAARLDPVLVAALAAFGEFVGGNVSYMIGRFGGRPFIERHGRRFRVGSKQIERAEGFFERKGGLSLVFSRPSGPLKSIVPTIAGASHMPLLRFEAYLTLAVVVYLPPLVALGYFLGLTVAQLTDIVSWAGWIIGALVVVAAVGWWLWRRHRRQDRA